MQNLRGEKWCDNQYLIDTEDRNASADTEASNYLP
jgi:hypothetical protein